MYDYSWMNYDQMINLMKLRPRLAATPLPKDRMALVKLAEDLLQGRETPFVSGASRADLAGCLGRG